MPKNSESSKDEFELKFYEEILKKSPDFIEALMALGDLYTKKGLWQKGLEIDLRLVRLRPYNPYVLYNLACSYSLVSDVPNAFNVIERAVECGYSDFNYLERDKDLENLRASSQFQEFILKAKNAAAKL